MVELKKIPARFFTTESGEEPVRTWLKSLNDDDRKNIGKDIQRVQFGWPIGLPVCRSLGCGLWEVRSNLSGGRISRVIFGFAANEIVLLHGFIKKTQGAPRQDVELALRRSKRLSDK